MVQSYLKIFAFKLCEIVSYLVFAFMLRIKLLFRYWRDAYRKSESKVFLLDFSSAVCSTPNNKKMRHTVELNRSFSTTMKTASRLNDAPLRSSFSEPKKKARRELFKPAQRKFLMEEEIFLKLPRKINNPTKKSLRI